MLQRFYRALSSTRLHSSASLGASLEQLLQPTKKLVLPDKEFIGRMVPIMKSLRPKHEQHEPHILHVNATRNNTICTLTDYQGSQVNLGKTITWTSAGTIGLKKAKRGSSDAGYMACLSLLEKVKTIPFGLHLKLKGFGPGREQAFRAVRAHGWQIVRISDVTPYRHAGDRPRKKRRL